MNELKNNNLDWLGTNTWFNAQDAYEKIQQNYNTELEIIISKSAYWSYKYSVNVLKAPFPLGEPIIANSHKIVDYAKNILQSRFKLAENTLNKLNFRDWTISNYIRYILKVNHD